MSETMSDLRVDGALPDVNAEPCRPVAVDTASMPWEGSPSATVWRKPLYREGGESGPVTSLVRFAPGGTFRRHCHPQGEEMLVLEGVFSDEHGDYPAGSYLLNPDGSCHTPASEPGCTLLVRLRQYPGARARVAVDIATLPWQAGGPGRREKALYRDAGHPERVSLERWEAGIRARSGEENGIEEIFVLEGTLEDGTGRHGPGSWLRFPPGHQTTLGSAGGCTLYRRTGGALPPPSTLQE